MAPKAKWREALDALDAGVRDLNELTIPGEDAADVALITYRLERKLWTWRRSVEATYLDRLNPVPAVLEAVAAQTNQSVAEVVSMLIGAGAIRMDYAKLDKHLHRYGLEPTYSEGEMSDGEDSDYEPLQDAGLD